MNMLNSIKYINIQRKLFISLESNPECYTEFIDMIYADIKIIACLNCSC